ncbi:type II toxin-antitoxin system HipA family toxin [Nocardioides pelophilus]|uniref:type II toxin-antitoxin system HipA family toxin n=1 Tax=Nocardioides pelophilus TaxID=2172019 RepID=UPI0016044E3A|nr:HipA domain-containing protein [Nocardioides pelophilus]
MTVPDELSVWLYGTHIASLSRGPRGRTDRIVLSWTPEAEARWGIGSRVLSNILPIGEDVHPIKARVFFDGYLPEGQSRTHHAVEAGVEPTDTFGLIATYGRDLAGAAIVVASGESPEPTQARYEPIDIEEVSRRLAKATLHTGRLDARDSFASLPGMVPKVLLHRDGETWLACRGGAPSTWIVKRSHDADGPAADVIDTEVLALRCAERIGLGNVRAEILTLDGMRAIAVARYDRPRTRGGAIGRVHQEDLAQAIGLNTDDANRKFQRGPAQMPSLRQAARVLSSAGADPDPLLALVTFSFALGNTDMHAKNISFLRSPRGRALLAPAYDVSLHLHAKDNNGHFALQVNAKSSFDEISVDDLILEAVGWELPVGRAEQTVLRTLTDLERALESERVSGSNPGVSDLAWDNVQDRVGRLVVAARGLTSGVVSPGRGRRGPRLQSRRPGA